MPSIKASVHLIQYNHQLPMMTERRIWRSWYWSGVLLQTKLCRSENVKAINVHSTPNYVIGRRCNRTIRSASDVFKTPRRLWMRSLHCAMPFKTMRQSISNIGVVTLIVQIWNLHFPFWGYFYELWDLSLMINNLIQWMEVKLKENEGIVCFHREQTYRSGVTESAWV